MIMPTNLLAFASLPWVDAAAETHVYLQQNFLISLWQARDGLNWTMTFSECERLNVT